MTLLSALTLLLLMLALALLPSASVALVVTRTASGGARSGIATAAGIVVGDLVFAAMALLGLTVLAQVLGGLFMVLRIAAGLYLIWLGVGLLRSRVADAGPSTAPRASRAGLLGSFAGGLLLTLGDAKAILFYASLFPTFVDAASVGLGDVLTICAVTVLGVGGAKLLYVALAGRLAGRFARLGRRRAPRVVAGSMLAGTGVYLAVRH